MIKVLFVTIWLHSASQKYLLYFNTYQFIFCDFNFIVIIFNHCIKGVTKDFVIDYLNFKENCLLSFDVSIHSTPML